MPTTQDIVQKLWNLCNILRDDGITYHEYVTELTYLLFLKMAKETGREDQIPRGYRWDDLVKRDGVELLDFYKKLLIDLGGKGSGRVQAIFNNASTSFRQPRHLRAVVDAIYALDWYSAKSEGLGDLYEGLLEKNAEETKGGAGQYFTPRPLIECMVALVQPQPGETVQDPAVGTGGFLINADRYVRGRTDDYHDLSVARQNFQRREAFCGVELVPDVQRLALMNAMLHDIEGEIVLGERLLVLLGVDMVGQLAEDDPVERLGDDPPVERVDVELDLVGELLLLERLRAPVEHHHLFARLVVDGPSYCTSQAAAPRTSSAWRRRDRARRCTSLLDRSADRPDSYTPCRMHRSTRPSSAASVRDTLPSLATLKDLYLERLNRALYQLEAGVQYTFLNSLIRSILQTGAIAALDYCMEEVDDVEQTTLPELAASLLAPADGAPVRVLDGCLPIIRQAGWPSCASPWFTPAGDGDQRPLNRRAEAWVKYRNDRPGHGVVAQDTIQDGLTWLPALARALVEGLADLMPEYAASGAMALRRSPPRLGDEPVPVASLRLHEDKKPIVVRSVVLKGASWRVSYQSLDTDASVDGTYELSPAAPLVALTRLEQRLYRAVVVPMEEATWRPTVHFPARQTDIFEGRKAETTALADWMNDTDSRACNVFGEGGIGKTTLVLEFLHAVLSGEAPVPRWRPDVICFFSAKETRWGPDGLQILRGAVPAVEDAAREIARSYNERLDKTWYEGDAKQIIDRAASLMVSLGLKRDAILLVLDNTETLARSATEEEELGRVIQYMAKRLCRVLVTSRRREKLEALPVNVQPFDDVEGARLLRRVGAEYHAQPLITAGESTLKKISRQLSGLPLLLDVLARLVGTFHYSLDAGVGHVMQLAAADLGAFLYEDAWTRIGENERGAFLVVGQLGGTVSGDIVGWACSELHVAHAQVLTAFEETRFGTIMDYGATYDLIMEPSARAFLAQKYQQLGVPSRTKIDAAVAAARRKHTQRLTAQVAVVNDRVARAFQTDAAKAAHQAAERGLVDEAVQWYEDAIQVDRGNAALLERFAWYLMKESRDYSRALRLAREACSADATDPDARFTAGMVLARMAEVRSADEEFARALALGKPAHLCALQRAQGRSRAIESIMDRDPVEISRANELLAEALQLLDDARLPQISSNLDAKHEAERTRTAHRLARHRERLTALTLARQRPA
jgi:Tfp pilus assembly protein PilF